MQHTQLSTLYTPSGRGPAYRRLPMVMHNAEHTLYEEPCVVAMDLLIGEVCRSHLSSSHRRLSSRGVATLWFTLYGGRLKG